MEITKTDLLNLYQESLDFHICQKQINEGHLKETQASLDLLRKHICQDDCRRNRSHHNTMLKRRKMVLEWIEYDEERIEEYKEELAEINKNN